MLEMVCTTEHHTWITCRLAVAPMHVQDAEFPSPPHKGQDDLMYVHPDISNLLVRHTLVERPRCHVLLTWSVGIHCNTRQSSIKCWKEEGYQTCSHNLTVLSRAIDNMTNWSLPEHHELHHMSHFIFHPPCSAIVMGRTDVQCYPCVDCPRRPRSCPHSPCCMCI